MTGYSLIQSHRGLPNINLFVDRIRSQINYSIHKITKPLDSVVVSAYHVSNINTSCFRSQHEKHYFAHENQRRPQRAASEAGRTGRAQFVESDSKSSVQLCHAQRSRTAFGALCIPALNGGAFRARLGKSRKSYSSQ